MKKEMVAAVSVLLVFVLLFSGFLILFLEGTQLPEGYVSKITRENYRQSSLFNVTIDRIPAKALITPPKLENNTVKVGVSADPSELNFGIIVKNMSVRKFINLKNDDAKVKVCVIPRGNVSRYLRVNPQDLVLSTGESAEVLAEFKGAELGAYTGEVDVVTKKPKYGFLEPLLSYAPC